MRLHRQPQYGDCDFGSGSRVILAGTYVNNLVDCLIAKPAGTTLELDGSWSSTSTLNVNGGTVNFGGARLPRRWR